MKGAKQGCWGKGTEYALEPTIGENKDEIGNR
jgi:hypothetical protein